VLSYERGTPVRYEDGEWQQEAGGLSMWSRWSCNQYTLSEALHLGDDAVEGERWRGGDGGSW